MRVVRWLSALLMTAVVFAQQGAANAQQTPQDALIGTWSTQGRSAWGEYIGVYFLSFRPDGTFVHRIIGSGGGRGPGSTMDYVGRYQLTPDGQGVDLLYLDFDPKQLCAYGTCTSIVPMIQPNTRFTMPFSMAGPNQMRTMDASGPILWVRQQ